MLEQRVSATEALHPKPTTKELSFAYDCYVRSTELAVYLSEMQAKACQVQALLEALVHLIQDDECTEGQLSIATTATEIVEKISVGLDSTNLPAAGQQLQQKSLRALGDIR